MRLSTTVTKNLSNGLSRQCNLERKGHLLRLLGVSPTQIPTTRFAVNWKTRFDSRTSSWTSISIGNSLQRPMHPISLLERVLGLANCCWNSFPMINDLFPIFTTVYRSRFGHLFHHWRHPHPLDLSLPSFFRLETRYVPWPLHVASCNRWYPSPVWISIQFSRSIRSIDYLASRRKTSKAIYLQLTAGYNTGYPLVMLSWTLCSIQRSP